MADEEQLQWLNKKMQEEYEIKFQVMGPEKHLSQDVKILNITLRWTQVGIEYEADLQHAGLVVKETETANMKKCKTPGITQESKALEKEKEDMSNEEQTKFRSVAARINFLATDRAALQFASKDLCRRMASRDKSDFDGESRDIECIDHEQFRSSTSRMSRSKCKNLPTLTGQESGQRSTSGSLLMWESSLLRSWSSTQNTIALSSAESELHAMSKCAQHALHLKSMGEDFGSVLKPWIRSDASAALGIAYRRGLAGKTRHVLVQYMWIQQEVANELVKIQKVLGTDNPADALTKVFPEAELERHMALRSLCSAQVRLNPLSS